MRPFLITLASFTATAAVILATSMPFTGIA
jgi:hypothetical protein